jgi:broad specificity polyphosphatase/5'/3'-nucleotidase SurE
MKLYNIDMPEIIPENKVEILKLCRKIHQDTLNRYKKKTQKRKWDEYWVNAYSMIIKELK